MKRDLIVRVCIMWVCAASMDTIIRSLVMKGTHFAAAVAFMFSSTNLVIELGVLILIFLGWHGVFFSSVYSQCCRAA